MAIELDDEIVLKSLAKLIGEEIHTLKTVDELKQIFVGITRAKIKEFVLSKIDEQIEFWTAIKDWVTSNTSS